MEETTKHSRHSVLREVILEHLLVGELLRALWKRDVVDAEILRSEFDGGGYDLVVSRNKITRHVQLKATMVEGKRSTVDVSLNLASKPSGCVVWMFVTPDLRFHHFLWFGARAGWTLPDISMGKVVKHTKGDSEGTKLDRPNLREVKKSDFVEVRGVEELLDLLLGDEAR